LSDTKPMRRWLAWTIASVWILTLVAVIVANHTHPATTAKISLSVKEISFRTSASHILGPSDEGQFLISGVGALQIQLNNARQVAVGTASVQASTLRIDGEPHAACTFYRVRTGGLDLAGPSIIALGVPSTAGTFSFNLKVHGSLSGRLSSRPGQANLRTGFECVRVHTNGGPVGTVSAAFSPEGGDSVFFATTPDAQLSFDVSANNEIGDTQIPIIDEVRLSHVDPRTMQEKTVLLKNKNEVSFDEVSKTIMLDEADLVWVAPKNEFYLSQFVVKDGVHLTLHGLVRDVSRGPGASNLTTVMPSSFDHLDNVKRIYGIVPSMVGLVLGILDKMRLLPER
jgi:hypothetical protein